MDTYVSDPGLTPGLALGFHSLWTVEFSSTCTPDLWSHACSWPSDPLPHTEEGVLHTENQLAVEFNKRQQIFC